MLKLRYEFIGLQNNETISGYMFANKEKDVTDYLKENKVYPYLLGLAGLVPEDFILSWEMVELLDRMYDRSVLPYALHLFNKILTEAIGVNEE